MVTVVIVVSSVRESNGRSHSHKEHGDHNCFEEMHGCWWVSGEKEVRFLSLFDSKVEPVLMKL